MIIFSIIGDDGSKVQYKLPSNATEIPCSKVIKFQQTIETKKPESLAEYEALATKEDKDLFLSELDPNEMNTNWASYYLRELQFWGNISLQDLGKIPMVADDDGADMFILRGILQKALSNIKYESVQDFKYKGDTYYFPESPPNLVDPKETDYMRGCSLGQFATAHELYRAYTGMQAGSCEALLNVIAVLCLKRGEELPVMADEQADFIKARVDHLRELDFQTAMNVGFFLTAQLVAYQNVSRFSRAAKAQKRAKSMVTILQSEQ
jgi:hypothetical protein